MQTITATLKHETTTAQGLPLTRIWTFKTLADGRVRMSDHAESRRADGRVTTVPAYVYTTTADRARDHWRNLTRQGFKRGE